MLLKPTKPLHNFLNYAGLGMRMGVTMGSFMWIGLKLDRYLGWKFPVFLSLLSVSSVVLSVYITIRQLMKQVHQEKEKRKS